MGEEMDPSQVPESIAALIPLAERWGFLDDVERSDAITAADRREIEELARCMGGVGDAVYEWLAGPESFREPLTDEYVAFTGLVEADLALVRLDHMDS